MRPLCKDCIHYRPERTVCVVFAVVRIPAQCLYSDVVFGDGRNASPCAAERSNLEAHACGPDGKHWEAA